MNKRISSFCKGISAPHYRCSQWNTKAARASWALYSPSQVLPGSETWPHARPAAAPRGATIPELQLRRPSLVYLWLLQLLPVWVRIQVPLRWPPAQGSWDSYGGTPRVHGSQIAWGGTQAPGGCWKCNAFLSPWKLFTFHCSHNWEVTIFTAQTKHILFIWGKHTHNRPHNMAISSVVKITTKFSALAL